MWGAVALQKNFDKNSVEVRIFRALKTKGATSFFPGGAKLRRGQRGWGLGGKRAEARRAEAAGDRVQEKGCPLSVGKKIL